MSAHDTKGTPGPAHKGSQPANTDRAEKREYPNLYQVGPNTYAVPWKPHSGQTAPGTVKSGKTVKPG